MTLMDDILQHHGVKGMKWGVRKKRSATKKTKFGKSPHRLSDAELKKRIARLEAEKRYNELNKADISAGRAMAKTILTQSGNEIASKLVKGVATLAIHKVLEAKFGGPTAKAVMPIKRK